MSCLQCRLLTEKEEEEIQQRFQEAKNAVMPKLIELNNDFEAGKITAVELFRRGSLAILEQELKTAEKELANNQNRPEVKVFFQNIGKEHK